MGPYNLKISKNISSSMRIKMELIKSEVLKEIVSSFRRK